MRKSRVAAHRGAERRPLALVLTKADKCDGLFENPREFAEAHASALWSDCRARFPATRRIRLLGDGATAFRDSYGRRQQVPLRIEPHGIVEPFGWLMTELDENWANPGVAAASVEDDFARVHVWQASPL